MSQQRKHYHMHPYTPQPPPTSSHHLQQQQQQQWYANMSQQQPYHQSLHIRDSRNMQHPHTHHPPPPPHAIPPTPPSHMFTSGYAGMSGGSVGAGAIVGATHNTTSPHNLPASGSSSAPHYSTLAAPTSGGVVGASNVSGSGGVIVSRNRVYDLEMINKQHHSATGGVVTSATQHSILSGGGVASGRTAYDAFSHSSLYAQQPTNQRLHHHQQQQPSSHYYPSHPHRIQQQQQPQHHHQQHSQLMTPMITNIKSEPLDHMTISPSIQMEEIIIKPEPMDEMPYHKNAPQIENNTFAMNEERKHQQQQQQRRLQQTSSGQEQKHHHHHQQHQHHHLQQQQHHHHQQQHHHQHLQRQSQTQPQPHQQHRQQQQQQQTQPQQSQHHRYHQTENVSQQQLQIPQRQQYHQPPTQRLQQQQPHHHHLQQPLPPQQQPKPAAATVNTEKSTMPSSSAAAVATAVATAVAVAEGKRQQISLANIKTEPKPLNFPRRKLQTERSSTLPICQRCKQVFLKRQSYTQHVALSCCNIVEYDFKCSICPMSFMSNEELQTHEQLHRLNRYFCQKYCGKYYETIDECEEHEFGQHEYEMFKCNICCVSFDKRNELFAHLMDHSQQPRYDCCICRLCFQSLDELEDHYVGNPDFCGKFYEKEAFKNLKMFSNPPKKAIQQETTTATNTNRSENLTSFLIKDITSLKMTETKTSTPKTTTENLRKNSPSNSYDDIPDFAAPLVEVKTEIKVEPDFYPPMDQSDFGAFDNDDFNNSQDYAQNSNQNLTFLQDFHDNASNSTNSSYSFNTSASSSKNIDAIQDDDAICCVPKCGVRKFTSPTLQFFSFPPNEKYLTQWLHNLKMTYDPNVNYGVYRVCSLHFPKRCIARYSLSYWAVPTFNLGHDDVGNLYQNRESAGGFPAGEMARCYMPGCPSQRGETNVKFHSFPRDLKTLIKWCQNSRLPVHSKENRFFCSRHFEEKCFGKFRLKPWAIPTLRLGTVYGKIHDNPNIYQEEKKCFLPFCRRSRSFDCNLSLYRFPRDETLLRRWCYNLRLDPEMYRGKNHKICSSHFVKEALGLRKLNPGAVPTMNLGHNDRFNIYENELYTPPPPPPPSQASASKSQKFAEMFKQEMGSTSAIYDDVFMNSMMQKMSSTSSSNSASASALDLGDVCLVPSCKRTRHSDEITLHTVPKRPEQLKKWCHNLKMDLDKLHKSVRICSAHFESYCIGGCMRPFAVPTLELGHEDTEIYRNPDVIKKLNIRETCCVQSCKRNRDRDHANLHRFPTHPELLQKWCENLQKPIPDGTRLFNDAVCEVHFEDRCLRNKRLEKWSIPTINLGYDDVSHKLPSEEEISEYWTKPFAPNNGEEQGECCVSSCKRNPQVDDVKLYRPPEDAEQLLKWAHNLQLDAADLPNLRICNLHFESHCIGKRLLNWAMPTLNLASNVEHLFENPPPTHVVYKKKIKPERITSNNEIIKWSPRCCLTHCRKTRSQDNVQLFRFPYANRQTFAKWCHNIQLPLVGTAHRRICSTHFDRAVLTKRCPMNFAVPTLDLNTPAGYKIYQNPARLKHVKPGVQRQCIIESCQKVKADGVVLFRFPNNRTLLQKWRHNIKQSWPKGKLSSQLRVCCEHFESHSVGGRRLSPGAIPTLKLGDDATDLYPNETRSYFEAEKCVVNGCESTKHMEDVRLFRFPRDDEELLQKWCNNLKMNSLDCVGIRICGKHFEDDCFGPKMLFKWAIPTQKLGHKDDDVVEIIQNPPADQRSGEMIFKCCVPGCGKSRKYDDAQMNSFPKHMKLFRKWKHNLKLDFLNFKEREKYKICNDHFESVCVGKTRLNFGALPTINLGHNDTEDLYKVNPQRILPNLFIKAKDIERMERKQTRLEETRLNADDNEQPDLDEDVDPLSTPAECCLDGCTAPKSIMREPYDIPETQELRKLWSRELKVDVDDLPSDAKLCGLHFQQIFKVLRKQMDAVTEESAEIKSDFDKLYYSYQKTENSLVILSCQCRVENCDSNTLNSDNRLFYFPYGKEIAKKWSHNTGIIPDEHRRYLNKVCALHFENYCITDTQRLRSWAIPTLNFTITEKKILYKNPDLTRLDKRVLGPHILKCAVKKCASAKESENVKLFNFPSDDDVLLKWCANLKMSRNLTPILKICGAHFESLCFGSSRIRSWAIPTKNLGHDDEPEYLNRTTIRKEVFNNTERLQLKQVKIKKSLDTIKCHVASCRKSRLQDGVRFYGLPAKIKMRRKWLHNLQIPSNKAAKFLNLKVCNLHFRKRCLEGKQIKPWAVPTLHLDHKESIFENPRRLQNPLAIQRCILLHCKNHAVTVDGIRTFVFPRSPEFLEKWSKNLKLDLTKCKGRLCHEHFEADVIGLKKLKNGAVPTLNLGHDDELPHDNLELKKLLQLKALQNESAEQNEEKQEEESEVEEDLAEEGNEVEQDDEDIDEEYDFDEDGDELNEQMLDSDYDEDDHIDQEENGDHDDDNVDDNYGEEEIEDNVVDNDDDDELYESDFDDEIEGELDEMEMEELDMTEEEEEEEEYDDDNIHDDEDEEIDLSKIRIRGTSQHWSSIQLKELRVRLVPIRQEDLLELSSVSSFERDRRSITPASSIRDLRSETQLSSEFNDLFANVDDHIQTAANGNDGQKHGGHATANETSTSISGGSGVANHQATSECNETLASANDDNSSITPLRTDKTLNNIAPICCLKHCGKEKTPEQHLTTYGFPKDPQLLQKWCDNLGLQPEECIGRVCIDHFELRVIGIRRLKQGAVPTLNLGDSRLPKHTNDETKKLTNYESEQRLSEAEQKTTPPPPYCNPKTGKQSVFRLCCLKHCRRKKQIETETAKKRSTIHETAQPSLLFFKFPTDNEMLKKWSANLRLPEKSCSRKELRVCSKHFETFVIDGETLKPNALPTLDLSYSKRPPVFTNNQKEIASKAAKSNGPKCFLKHCAKPEDTETFLINFPEFDRGIQRRWCKNLKLDLNIEKHLNLKICNHHFESCAFYKQNKLKHGAIPTINLGHTDAILRNIPKIRRQIIAEPKEMCCIKTCSSRDTKKLYHLPKNSELRRIWCNNLQIELREALSCHYKLCGLHFSPESFVAGSDILKISAVPTLNLGAERENLKVLSKIEMDDDQTHCVVESCKKTASVDKIKLFNFPPCKELLEKWLYNLNLSADFDIEKSLICQRHFEKVCIKNGTLHEKALPTKFLKAKAWFYQNDEEMFEVYHKCCVSNCNYDTNEELYRTMYKFPKQVEEIDKWLFNLKLEFEDAAEIKDLRICCQHFEEACKSKEHLQPNSVPTLFLGHEQTADIFLNHIQKCCIANCAWLGIAYHKLPETPPLRDVWLKALQNENCLDNMEYLCSVHFLCWYERIHEMHESTPKCTALKQLYQELKCMPALNTFKCSVPKCKTGFKLQMKLLKFPKDVSLFQKWLHNASLSFVYAERPRYRICERHFETRCLTVTKLHRWSVPTLALPFNQSFYGNPPEALPSNHENLKHCCVSSCDTEEGPFFKFPTKTCDAKKWIHNLNLGAQQCTLNLRVCHKHFENYCLTRDEAGCIIKLKYWSVPTLNLLRTRDLFKNPSDRVDFFACCICREQQNKSEGLIFFRFPSRQTSLLKWLHNLRLQRKNYRESMKVCSKHFETNCFDRHLRVLRKHSVPTIGVACPKRDQFKNPIRRTKQARCCVASCQAPWLHLNVFPKDKILLRKWCFNLNIKENDDKQLKICQKHFETNCLNAVGLIKAKALPTLNLGHTEKIFKNSRLMGKSKTLNEGQTKRQQMTKSKKLANINTADLPNKFTSKRLQAKLKQIKAEKVTETSENLLCKITEAATMTINDQSDSEDLPLKALRQKPQQQLKQQLNDQSDTEDLPLKTLRQKQLKQKESNKLLKTAKKSLLSKSFAATTTAQKRKIQTEQQKDRYSKVIATTTSTHMLRRKIKPEPQDLKARSFVIAANNSRQAKNLAIEQQNMDKRKDFKMATHLKGSKKAGLNKLNTTKIESETNYLIEYIMDDASEETATNLQTEMKIKQENRNPSSLARLETYQNLETNLNYNEFYSDDLDNSQLMPANYQDVEANSSQLYFNTMENSLDDSENSLVMKMQSTEVDLFNETPVVSKFKSKCSITICQNMLRAGDSLFFCYPPNARLRAIWLRHCQETSKCLQLVMKRRKICSYHFEDICFIEENRLLFGAIPTLGLGLNSKDLENCAEFVESFRSFRCLVSTCQRSVECDQICKLSFPEGELKKKWCFNLNIQEKDVSSNDWICHKHFERRVLINNRSVKVGAVPTLLLGLNARQENQLYQNPEYVSRVQYLTKLSQECCVASCSNTKLTEDKVLFRFPKNKHIYEKWLHNLNLKDSYDIRNGYSICSDHFESVCHMNSSHLKLNSIPTLKLDKKQDLIALDESQLVQLRWPKRSFSKLVNAKKHACAHPKCNEKWANIYLAPQIDELKMKWLEYIGLDANSPPTNGGELEFCDEHFYELHQKLKYHLQGIDSKMYEKELQILEETFAEVSSKRKFLGCKCMVAECETDRFFEAYKNIQLHRVSSKPEVAQKWCHNCCFDYAKISERPIYYKVCDRHFESYCYNRFGLFYWATPTLNLPSNRPLQIYEPDEDFKWGYTGKCCISSCINANGLNLETKTRFHKFPQNQDLLATWLHNVNCVNFNEDETKICGLHFRSVYIKNKEKITEDAIPTLSLGLDSKAQIYTEPICNYLGEVKEEPLEIEEYNDEFSNMPENENKTFNSPWLDHDYCYETKTKAILKSPTYEEATVKQEIMDEFYDIEQPPLDIPAVKLEILDIEETENPQEVFEFANEPLTENIIETIPSHNYSQLLITEVKSQIFLCCVPKCINTSETRGVKLYVEFPTDSEIFIKWCFNIKIDPRNYKENQYAICSQHFETICFSDNNLTLHSWAVPTINLNLSENAFIHHNDPPSEQCIVYGCIQPLQPLYKFPLRLDLCQKWFSNLKLDHTDYRAFNYRICRRHFPAECFDGNFVLKTESIPTLFLGHADRIVYVNGFEASSQDPQDNNGNVMAGVLVAGSLDNSRGGSSQGSLLRNQLISPNDLEDHDSSYFEDFEECCGADD